MFHRFLVPRKSSFFLLGPRGTGKSTWIQSQFEGARVYDLLQTDEALRLGKNPSLLSRELAGCKEKDWIVIDEIQKVPELLDEVHRLIEKKKLRFVLSGSSARKLRRSGVNLLAGRALISHLFPLVTQELGKEFQLDRALQYGTLPMAIGADRPQDYLKAYALTYLEEEIKAEALTRNIGGFARFLEIAARQNGQVTNVSNLSRDSEVARQTVQTYFDLLVDTLVGNWLPAWKLKRSTKQIAHPKFYFFDTGVVRALSERIAYPLQSEERGHLFETLVLNEVRAFLSYSGLDYPVFFWSSHDGVEVDLFLESADGYLAFEIKSSPRWEKKYSNGLHRIQGELKSKVKAYGIYTGAHSLSADNRVEVLTFQDFAHALWAGKLIR